MSSLLRTIRLILCLGVAVIALAVPLMPYQPFFGEARIMREAFWSLGYGPLSFASGGLLAVGAIGSWMGSQKAMKFVVWWGLIAAAAFSALVIEQRFGYAMQYEGMALMLGLVWGASIKALSLNEKRA